MTEASRESVAAATTVTVAEEDGRFELPGVVVLREAVSSSGVGDVDGNLHEILDGGRRDANTSSPTCRSGNSNSLSDSVTGQDVERSHPVARASSLREDDSGIARQGLPTLLNMDVDNGSRRTVVDKKTSKPVNHNAGVQEDLRLLSNCESDEMEVLSERKVRDADDANEQEDGGTESDSVRSPSNKGVTGMISSYADESDKSQYRE
jgi:hypothetical protein